MEAIDAPGVRVVVLGGVRPAEEPFVGKWRFYSSVGDTATWVPIWDCQGAGDFNQGRGTNFLRIGYICRPSRARKGKPTMAWLFLHGKTVTIIFENETPAYSSLLFLQHRISYSSSPIFCGIVESAWMDPGNECPILKIEPLVAVKIHGRWNRSHLMTCMTFCLAVYIGLTWRKWSDHWKMERTYVVTHYKLLQRGKRCWSTWV